MNTRFSFSYFSCCHLFLLVVLALLFRLCLSNQNSDDHVLCLDGERQALLKFKDDLFDQTGRLDSWVGENKDCCKWAGIACDNSTGHVHQIHLPGFDYPCDLEDYHIPESCFEEDSTPRLRGDISPSLLELKQLKHLDLSNNDFGGIEVPKFLSSLQNLRYLNLSNSYFHGIIPPQLGNLTKLRVLCLGKFNSLNDIELTSLMNMQWLSSLSMLHHLDMSNMNLSKATDWFRVINILPSLIELHLSNCQLSNVHSYVPSLNLSSLSLLDLSNNDFGYSSMSQWIFSINSLVLLDLSGCNFNYVSSRSTYSFRNLTSLEVLHVSSNYIISYSSVLQDLSESNIILLDISYCGVSSSHLDSLHNLTSLLTLNLGGNDLTKTIPNSLGNLCNLREIDLSFNQFGNISLSHLLRSFFKCKSPALESLSVRDNNMVGIIPHSIGQLSSLRTLNLFQNGFSGPIPYSIGKLSSLEELDLRLNQLNSSLPDSIGRLSLLKQLYLSDNRLDGSLPDSLGQLSKLVMLDFARNLLTGVVTEGHFEKLVSLKILDGKNNELTLRVQVANWTPPFQLQSLYLNSWVLGPHFPLWLQSQNDLVYLDIHNTSISSLMPESFMRSSPNLVYIDVSHNRIRGTLRLASIPAMPELIDLSSNEFSGSLHHFMCSNNYATFTLELNLGYNHFSGGIPNCLDMWAYLMFLNLENNNLRGKIPRTLGSLKLLQSLNMRGNKISGRIPSSIMNLSDLKSLQLGRNELVGSIPTWIGTKFTDLSLLNLRSNNFVGRIPNELCYLTQLQILDLAHNNLSGYIPRCIYNFSVLSNKTAPVEYFQIQRSVVNDSLVMKGREDAYNTILGLVMLIDLSSNNLVGHIPSEITSLRALTSLNLSRNHLIGRIPKNIGDMKELESFDLSLNELSGELPMSLSKLNSLTSFNVSYNKFNGRIPTSTQIQSLNESSFFGNKLSGPPLTETNARLPVEVPTQALRDRKKDDERDWGMIISIMLGFFTGFWIIMGPLIARRSWRIAYFGLLNKLRYMVYDSMH